MDRVCSPGVLLIVFFIFCVVLTEATVQRITHREHTQVMMGYRKPKNYPCMEDWNKVCDKDDDCCSRKCLVTFCKIQGVEVPTTPQPRKRNKLKRKGKGKGALVNSSGRSPAENKIVENKVK